MYLPTAASTNQTGVDPRTAHHRDHGPCHCGNGGDGTTRREWSTGAVVRWLLTAMVADRGHRDLADETGVKLIRPAPLHICTRRFHPVTQHGSSHQPVEAGVRRWCAIERDLARGSSPCRSALGNMSPRSARAHGSGADRHAHRPRDLGPGASAWYGVVVRGEHHPDPASARGRTCRTTSSATPTCMRRLTVGEGVTVGHLAVLHGCTVEDALPHRHGSMVLTTRSSAGTHSWQPRRW